ncbi:P-loop containing nucleoside triphosphate hydrolase protein [Roridomyces roridus]|uniref:P-loop containing nucleoside triphosphate hydrolase protein n=1 Tax=Roridomyces roridus TaxID=1738132 RepID=A0AAD7B736_9AGAR|nr:P-loop containing nucleoside triphosphate hydrolase protein [Roridomyces roridus]
MSQTTHSKPTEKARGDLHPDPPLDPSLEVVRLGVFEMTSMKPSSAFFTLIGPLRGLRNAFPTIRKLTLDIFNLAPVLFPLLCLEAMFSRVAPVVMWHLLNRILFMLEAGLTRGQLDAVALGVALLTRISFSVLVTLINCWSRHADMVVQNRIIQHFEAMSFDWKCKAEKSTLQECEKKEDELTYTMVWYHYRDLLSAAGGGLSILTFTSDLQQCIWDRAWAANSVDPNFNRMQALKSMVDEPEYKHEIISGNFVDYLGQEYRKARHFLGDVSVSYPAVQYESQVRAELEILSKLLGEIHLFYFIGAAIFYPAGLSISKIRLLPQAGEMITADLTGLMKELRELEKNLTSVTRIYNLANTRGPLRDGNMPLEPATQDGISIRLENVEFAYEGSKSQTNALRNVSLSIDAGQLVVIVGTNGSGKSTLLNLLARIHDCSSGRILIEGQDIRDYKVHELREATAILMQDHHLYPLSFGENIGIGYPKEVDNCKLIEESAKKGGAHGFISTRYADKYDTTLEPKSTVLDNSLSQSDDDPLNKVRKSFEKSGNLSGGERQRVAASRAFMRLSSKRVKLFIADEPTSALDPEAESALLENLLKERQGKTMIFVTHRFSVLTQRADLILCMKDGGVVEQGTHETLMDLKGDYFRLYNTQADAFNSKHI